MEVLDNVLSFQSLNDNVGRFNSHGKMLLIPEMNRIGSHLLAAGFRAFNIHAIVLPTGKGLDLGQEYTSGKECYPCQITMGDILHFLFKEKERLGNDFRAEKYLYFLPESSGPCRFGMYNKYQRLVLDSFPEFSKVRISFLTSNDGYSLSGMIEEKQIKEVRKVIYLAVVTGDILDRLLWRIRPYERVPGITDKFIVRSTRFMEEAFEGYGVERDIDIILDKLDQIVKEGKDIIDPGISPKPKIGIVGEIYLRSHVYANQDLIRMLENYGAEVVNASIVEWVNYTVYDALRNVRINLKLNLKQFYLGRVFKQLREVAGLTAGLLFQERIQKRVYKRVRSIIDIAEDHPVGYLEDIIKENDCFSFDMGTEACLSIPGIMQYVRGGFNGVVNVYPFTCMPSTVTSAIAKPLMNRVGIPYLDTPYDAGSQPGRDSELRTFMYQACQNHKRQ